MERKRYLGNDIHKKELRKRFSKIKKNLVQRVYNTKDPSYKYYGGDGVEMDLKWKNDLNSFINDVTSLPGYDESLFMKGELSLDKDYLGNSKRYDKYSCCWVSKAVNNKNKPHQQNRFVVINSITGDILGYFTNQSEVARIIGTYQANISKALRETGHYKEYTIKHTQ